MVVVEFGERIDWEKRTADLLKHVHFERLDMLFNLVFDFAKKHLADDDGSVAQYGLIALGEDVLLFNRMSGSEQLGRLFEYNITVLCEKNTINPNDILGKNVTVKISSWTADTIGPVNYMLDDLNILV